METFKTGIEAFSEERQKQIDKHGFTGQHHAEHPEWYDKGQLIYAASYLSQKEISWIGWSPVNWDHDWFRDICDRPFEERLKIAGALLAAEWDRQKALGNF